MLRRLTQSSRLRAYNRQRRHLTASCRAMARPGAAHLGPEPREPMSLRGPGPALAARTGTGGPHSPPNRRFWFCSAPRRRRWFRSSPTQHPSFVLNGSNRTGVPAESTQTSNDLLQNLLSLQNQLLSPGAAASRPAAGPPK